MYEVLGDRKACLARELTKLHEQYHRGSLGELCQLHDLKGEMVLIVEGDKKEDREVDLEKLLDEVEQLVNGGLKSKQAVNEVSSRYGFSKNVLYNAYLKKDKR